MMMLPANLPLKTLVVVASASAGAFFSWWVASSYCQASKDALIASHAAASLEVMQAATQTVVFTERTHAAIATKLEVENAKTRNRLDKTLDDNRRLARDLGMRDPYAIACGDPMPTTTTTASGTTDSTTGGRLSDEAAGFLLDLAREADRASEYANTCYEWIEQVK